MVLTRIRVRFDFTPVSYARKCWFVFDSDQCSLVGDVAYLISTHFELQNNHEHSGIELYMDDYLIPTNESSEIIRDNDVIEVKATQMSLNKTSPSGAISSDELQPKSKRRKKSKVKRSTNHKQAPSDSLVTVAPNVSKTTPTSSAAPPLRPNPPKPLRTVSTKSVSGGVHTTFHSSSSSSESSDSSNEDKQSSKQTPLSASNSKLNSKSINSTVPRKKSLVGTKTVKKSPGGNARVNIMSYPNNKSIDKTPPVLKSPKPGVGRRGDVSVKINRCRIPSHVIVGGPDDVHTTRSKVYRQTVDGSENNGIVKSTEEPLKQMNTASKTAVNKTNKTSPEAQTATTITAVCDYSTLTDLLGAPRAGDKLAFKLLELSSSCTPEVSDYKEADVLSYDVATKTVKVKYTEATLRKLQKAESDSPSILAKFMLENEQEDEEGTQCEDSSGNTEVEESGIVELTLDSLISPKLFGQ